MRNLVSSTEISITGDPTIGLEEIQRETLLLMHDQLNDMLVRVANYWAVPDQNYAARLGRTYTPLTLEPVAEANFHDHMLPSMLKAPIDDYPNCAVYPLRAQPASGSELYDHQTAYRVTLYVELMARSSVSAGEASSRAMRMAEAANICIQRSRSLNGLVGGLDADPTIVLGEPFVRREQTAYGEQWYWRGARLEYAVRKEAVIGLLPAGLSPANYPHMDIDQP